MSVSTSVSWNAAFNVAASNVLPVDVDEGSGEGSGEEEDADDDFYNADFPLPTGKCRRQLIFCCTPADAKKLRQKLITKR